MEEFPKYKTLQADMVKGSDRELAATIGSFVESGEDAYKLAGHEGFSYRVLDRDGKCGVVLFKGIEVALLFKRQVVERQPWPSEPIPVNVLHEPREAWLRIDLLDSTPVEKQKGIQEKLRKSMEQVERLRMLWQDEESKRKKLEEELKKWESERETLKGLRLKVAMLEQQKK